MVLNLLENAAYHGKHTTKIRITSKHDGHFVSITISDNGAGISKEKLAKLFAGSLGSYNQNADEHKHMGIGLSVCKSIIKAHGGSMSACNNEQGGASFTFTLPEKENEYGCQDPDR